MDKTSWKPKVYKATESVDYKVNENLEDLEISGSDFSITHGGTVVSCNSCSKTWFVGQYPRNNVNDTEREINSHGDAHAPLDSLFNISGKSGSSDGSCKQCGAIPDNEDYVGHLKQHGTDYIGESKANETQYGTLNPDGSVTNKMDLDDSNSDDPIAYNFGFFEGKSGKPMDDYDDLAPEYVRGYNDGKKSIGESKAKAVEKTVLEVAKYYEGEQSFEEQFQAWIDPSNYSSSDAYKDATGGYMIDDEHSRIEFARWQLGYDESSHWYMDYEGESKASELDLKNYTINPFDDVWVSECKKCGAEFTEFDYDNSENSVRNHLMSEHDIDESHLGSTLYNQNESKANEDDHKKSWSELDSIAKMGFSDIGYDQKSWDSEPEEVRAEMETVVKDNMSQENWKEVANKIYKEELNKGKKSGGESSYENWIDELDPIEIIMDNFDPDNKDGSVKCDHCGYELIHDGSIMSTNIQREAKDHMINNHINELESNASSTTSESKVKRYKVGDDYYDDLDDAKRMSDVTGYAVFDNDNWGKMVYDGESKASEFNYNVLIKGKPSKEKLRDEFAPYVNIEDDGKNTRVIFDGLVDGGKQELESLGYDVIGESKASEEDPCWKGYKQIGMKDKNGKQVPNCVPNSSGNEYSLSSMFKKKKSNFHNTSFKDYAKVFEEPIESKWERKKHVLGGDFYDFFRLEWNSVPSEIQDIFRATVSVESKADEFTDWGNWAEDETGVGSKMSQYDQIAMMKDLGIADKTLRNMGYNLQKDGIEGFIDRIEKELSKFGINLDKPEEQEQED